MLDFMRVSKRTLKDGTIELYPTFQTYPKSEILMIRGGDFYAIWDEKNGLWSTDEDTAKKMIDDEVLNFKAKHGFSMANCYLIKNAESGVIDKWHKFCQKQLRDSYHNLDETLIFANKETVKEDYATKKLPYSLKPCDIKAYDELMSVLYSKEERHKIEWAIGAVVTGDSKKIHKFIVLYGEAGTGKSTVLNIIMKLFDGYCSVFDAKALGSVSSVFALEAFKSNPLVAIQQDGDLSRIEDNTRLNSLVSHELMTVNEKYKSTYENSFKAFLFMGTNKPVKITDAKSGLLRRLIDVHPTGDKIPRKKYDRLVSEIDYELGGIACHCRDVYLKNPGYYDSYIPKDMLGASNDFYNYVLDNYLIFKKYDSTGESTAWEMYKTYCNEANVPRMMPKRVFKEELKNYFKEYFDNFNKDDGTKVKGYYKGFRSERFETTSEKEVKEPENTNYIIDFNSTTSIFDECCKDCKAQYAKEDGTPIAKWSDVTTTLKDIDTSKLHYVLLPLIHIVADFDLKDENGNKSFEKNLEAASKWPKTYAELSKSGAGIHLHYFYTGNPLDLSRVYDEDIEIKVFNGNSSLRRKLTKCNNEPIATISGNLPLKERRDSMIDDNIVKNEKSLRTLIKNNIMKKYHPGTKPSVDFICDILNKAYDSGTSYDVSDMFDDVLEFASRSTNHSDYCVNKVLELHFKSDDIPASVPFADQDDDKDIVFYDIEVFPNLLLVVWKKRGENMPLIHMFNPTPQEVSDLFKFKLVGFNCRRYDNHILYARSIGYDNQRLFELSSKIVNSKKGENRDAFFGAAYNISYTDIYDFASAANKKSLKKFEIELKIHHLELGLPWDKPVPEEKWPTVAKYCDNDVISTEKTFDHLKGDWIARKILADLTGLTVNDTTNTLTTKLIFGDDKAPQSQFNYRDLSKPVGSDQYEEYVKKFGDDYHFRVFDDDGMPQYRDYIPGEELPKGWSILPFFKGYKYELGISTYLDEKIGEGGRVYAEPGMHVNVLDDDIASQHPNTIIQEVLFGPKYTKRFKELVDARVAIKHEEWDKVSEMFNGKLKKYIQMVLDGYITSKELANAFKTAINSVYGLTKASFKNPFRDSRNIDNIVAKRGALFMTLLKREVQKLGYSVCHIKTDSIKVPNATPYIHEFILKFAKEFGYSYEIEAEFSKFCLVNDSVYIAKFKEPEVKKLKDGTQKEIWWTATGKQFAVPYVFKTLFSHDPIEFDDMCETFETKQGELYLDFNEGLPDVSKEEKEFDKLETMYKKGKLSDIEFEKRCQELNDIIATGHNYTYVGRVGLFTPVKEGTGGGVLYRIDKGKPYAASGTTGYRWKESETVKNLGMEDTIDKKFYTKLVDDAVDTISKFGDFEWFVSDDPIKPDFINPPETDEDEDEDEVSFN